MEELDLKIEIETQKLNSALKANTKNEINWNNNKPVDASKET